MASGFFTQLFTAVFRLRLFVELRLIGAPNRVRSLFSEDLQGLQKAIANPEPDYNYFFGVHPRSRKEGTSDAVEYVTCMYADLDFKTFGGDEQAVLDRICGFPLEPTVLIDSGHGLHPYWIFESPVAIRDVSNYQAMLRALQEYLGSDPVHDLARIMRVPGTMNLKYPQDPVLCQILEANCNRYEPSNFEFLLGDQKAEKDRSQELIPKGTRNNTLTSIAGKLRNKGLDEKALVVALTEINVKRCQPPLPEAEVAKIAHSISKYLPKKASPKPSESHASKLVALAESLVDLFFHDQTDRPYALIDGIVLPIGSERFKDFVAKLYWETEACAPPTESLGAAINVLRAKARFDGPEVELYNRVGQQEEKFYFDLVNPASEVVEITPAGWNIIKPTFPLFYKFSHQLAQVRPVEGGNLANLDQFLNINDEAILKLIQVVLVVALVPDIAHPVLLLHGPQGSAKTTMLKILRALIDPSVSPTLTLPPAIPELAQILYHHWFPCFDNITKIHEGVSDTLCRAVTGEGFSKRQLYTDEDDVIFQYRRPIAISGIVVAAVKPDLLDRSLITSLDSIQPENRDDEKTLWADLQEMKPGLFGAMLDTLSRAMKIRPLINLSSKPRLADFALWGCAVAEALGIGQAAFLEAYDSNLKLQNEEVLSSSPIAVAVLELMEGEESLETTATDLLSRLSDLPGVSEDTRRSKFWPKAPHVLSTRLKELEHNLGQVGVEVSWGRDRQGRKIILTKRAPR